MVPSGRKGWYQAAVAQGHPDALFVLGNRYNTGDGVHTNPGLALKLWRKCAQHHEAGDITNKEGIRSVAAAHYNIGTCYRRGSDGLEVDMPMAMQWCKKAAEQGDQSATIGEIYLKGFLGKLVPVGTFDRDVPLGMKYLSALTLADQTKLEGNEPAAISKAEALMRDFHAAKSCMGCDAPKLGSCAAAAWTTTTPRLGTAVKPVSSSTGATRRPRTKPSADLAPPPATAPGLRRADATFVKRRAARSTFLGKN
jgi:hypothetical protein